MSNISSNSLFHFTPKSEYLIGILKNNFIPRYSLENVPLSSKLNRRIFKSAIPMVCFCDISLSQISDHINLYGNYGIGMTKEWGIKNKLNPIIYVNKNSIIGDSLSKMAEDIHFSLSHKIPKIDSKLSENKLNIVKEFMNITSFIKPYQGDFTRNESVIKDVKFYNEKEWRFVPNFKTDNGVNNYLELEKFNDSEILNSENNKLKKYQLSFNPNDIKYIFVKSKEEIHPMIETLRNIKGINYSENEIDILTSKILTTEQILEDF